MRVTKGLLTALLHCNEGYQLPSHSEGYQGVTTLPTSDFTHIALLVWEELFHVICHVMFER